MLRFAILICMLPALVIGGLQVSAQNLVTNPGFELKNKCPVDRSEIAYTPNYDFFGTVLDWVSPLNTSPDYFNRCGVDSTVRIPYLAFDGFHEPRHGDAFAGISMYSGHHADLTKDFWCEYLETKLSEPLIAGHDYYISYYVSMTYHIRNGYNTVAIDHIGARLTENMIDTICTAPMFFLPGPADIETPTGYFISDTAGWSLVAGIYHGLFLHRQCRCEIIVFPRRRH